MNSTQEYLDTDLYAVLGVTKDASAAEVKKAYRKLARELHPDHNKTDPDAEAKFKRVSEAYSILGDASRRREYDEARDAVARGAFRRPAGTDPDLRFDFATVFGEGDRAYGDLFADLFSAGGGATPRPRRGRDLETAVTIDFAAAMEGTTVPVRVPSGQTSRTLKARIAAGVADGQQIKLKGKGRPGQDGGPAGDLYVTVHVRPHPVFGRSGDNLTMRVPVTFAEAALGAEITVPTLDGAPVTVRLPAGTPSGRTLRVRGKGVRRRDGGRGDLLVTVEVTVPTKLSGPARDALKAYAAATAGQDPRAGLFPPTDRRGTAAAA